MLFHEQTLDPVKKTDIFVVRSSGGDAVPVVEGPLEQSQAVFSPDGRAIAYVSNESGVSEVFVQPFSHRALPLRAAADECWCRTAAERRRTGAAMAKSYCISLPTAR